MKFWVGNFKVLLISLVLFVLGFFALDLIRPQPEPADEVGNWQETGDVLGVSSCPDFSSDLVKIDGQLLRTEAANQLKLMRREAEKLGMTFKIYSGFRTAAQQAAIYTRFSRRVAPPGKSEHQLGTAADLVLPFGQKIYPSKSWDWLDQNAHKFGFVMSYRGTQTTQTGFQFEPWHWRYVGVDLATQIRYSPDLPQRFYRKISCQS